MWQIPVLHSQLVLSWRWSEEANSLQHLDPHFTLLGRSNLNLFDRERLTYEVSLEIRFSGPDELDIPASHAIAALQVIVYISQLFQLEVTKNPSSWRSSLFLR